MKGDQRMRQFSAAFSVVAVSMLIVSCGNESGPTSSSSSSSMSSATTTSSKPPVAQAALANLSLTPAEIDSLLGVTGSKSKEKIDKLASDTPTSGAWKFPDECFYILGPVETPVYAGSGNTAVSGDDDVTSLNNDQDIEVGQAVVLFPSAKEANDFFSTSAQRWPACADRQFTMPASADMPELSWKTGPFANANGTLSVTVTNTVNFNAAPSIITFQRALTVRNNVVIDVALMRKDPADFAVKVAGQIADKVDKQ
jgi:hypothetical protein